MTDCQDLHPLMAGFLADELTPDARARVATHISACALCAEQVSAFVQLERTLIAAADPRYQVSSTSDQRLQRAIDDEIALRTRPARMSVRRMWPTRPLLAGTTVATALVLVVFFFSSRPSPADALTDAIKAIEPCKTVHVTGYTNRFGFVDENNRRLNPPRMEPLEIWWSKDDRAWIRVGECVIVRDRSQLLLRYPKGAKRTNKAISGFRDLNEFASAENYLRNLRARARGRETYTTIAREAGVLKVTISAGSRYDTIELDARTKRMLRMEMTKGKGDLAVRQRLDSFTYDQPFPPHVLKDLDSILQPQDSSLSQSKNRGTR